IEARVIDLAQLRAADDFKASGKLEEVTQMAASLSAHLITSLTGASAEAPDYTVPRSAFENYIRSLLTQDLQRRTELLKEALRLNPQYSAASYQLGRTYHLDREFKASNE